MKDNALTTLYKSDMARMGTEEMTQEDLNIPYLILLQNGTNIPELRGSKKTGWYYRSDTSEQIEAPAVNFVYVTTEEKFDEIKKETRKIKAYYGFYAGTKEPFKIRMGGWGLAAHKQLQTEISMYQQRLNVPMFALTMKLTSENKTGVTKTNEKYNVEKIVCEIVKDEGGKTPLIEMDPERIAFLYEAVGRFKMIAPFVEDTTE